MKSKVLSENAREVNWHFVCEGCEAEGDLTVAKSQGMRPFGCPEGCGATYVQWKPSTRWELRCVVKPYFEDRYEDQRIKDLRK